MLTYADLAGKQKEAAAAASAAAAAAAADREVLARECQQHREHVETLSRSKQLLQKTMLEQVCVCLCVCVFVPSVVSLFFFCKSHPHRACEDSLAL